MTPVEAVARVIDPALWDEMAQRAKSNPDWLNTEASFKRARAAIEALAANVTDEMVSALRSEARFRMIGEETDADYHRRAIAAAIRTGLAP